VPERILLPRWTDRADHAKQRPIVSPTRPPAFIESFLNEVRTEVGDGLRVLDVGCGRGDTVVWLLERGWDAWGVDVNPAYTRHGRDYLDSHGWDPERLRVGFPYPVESSAFDVVVSDQVIEHVANLPAFTREVARISAAGGRGLHIFPARWSVLEPHLGMPFVHWFPKRLCRRLAISVELRLHLGPRGFDELTTAERSAVFSRFSDEETFYRSPGQVARQFESRGFETDVVAASLDKVSHELGFRPRPPLLATVAAVLYRHAFSVVVRTRRVR
jgi:SAM-dependent methyltransferase